VVEVEVDLRGLVEADTVAMMGLAGLLFLGMLDGWAGVFSWRGEFGFVFIEVSGRDVWGGSFK
jgi:hypothetical protein